MYFVIGASAPLAAKFVRPAARTAVKNGLRLRRKLETATARLRDELGDLAAEAAAELDSVDDRSEAP